ncbi:hypothetical protein [Caballeronia fortuita]|nr:hypothetical protein [Caballeronia fortuita]
MRIAPFFFSEARGPDAAHRRGFGFIGRNVVVVRAVKQRNFRRNAHEKR